MEWTKEKVSNLKSIPDYFGYYCSMHGKIFSNRKGKLIEIKGSKDKDGYLKITLVDKYGKFRYFRKHRLIILTFIGYSDLQVNHIDGDVTNNNLSNLEYVTLRENQCHRRLNKGFDVGVCWAKKEKKWRAYIQHNKKWEHLGFFEKKDDAKNAYINKLSELNIKNKYHGKFKSF